MNSKLSKRFTDILTGSYLALVYGFIFLPVIVLILFSFQSGSLPLPPFEGPSFRWYEAVFADRNLMASLRNSVVVGVLSSLVAVTLAFLAAYALARHKPKGSAWLRGFLTAPLSVSYLITAMGLLAVFNMLAVEKSLLTVGLGHVVINLPLCFAIIFSQMGEAQARLERAGRDLGATEWQILTRISAPLLAPAILVAFFLAFTLSWDEFIIAFLLSRFDVTLPVEIWTMLRSGLNPKTNAVGSLVFIVSVGLVVLLETTVLRRRRL